MMGCNMLHVDRHGVQFRSEVRGSAIVNYHAAYREGGQHDAPRQEIHFAKDDVAEDFDGKSYSGHLMSVLKHVQAMEAAILDGKPITVNEIEVAKCIAAGAACRESINNKQNAKVFNEF